MTAAVRLGLAAALSLVLAACGGGSNSAPPPKPVSASRSTLTATPASVTADGLEVATVTARALDADGAPLAGRTAVFSATGGGLVFSSGSAVTGASGAAAVTLASSLAEAKEVSVTIDGVLVAARASVTFVAGAPSVGAGGGSTTTPPPGPVPAGSGGAPVSVTLVDASGNPVPGVTVTFEASGGELSSTTAVTGADGVATVTVTSTTPGEVVVTATVGGTPVGQPVAVQFMPGAPDLGATLVSATPGLITAGGEAATVRVVVLDAHGNPVPGVVVTLTADGEGNTLVQPAQPTDAGGVATGTLSSLRAEGKTVTAWLGGAPASATAAVVVLPGAPSVDTSSLTGPAAPVVADGATAAAFRIALADAFGNAIPGATVGFSTTAGRLSAAAATTGVDGAASVSLTSTAATPATVTATAGALSLQAGATFVAGSAAALVVTAQPAAGTAGVALSPVTVEARDAQGNATALPGDATVSLASAPAGASLLGATTVAAPGASASFTGLAVQRSGAYALHVASGGLGVDAAPFTVQAAQAASLALAGLPATATAGAPHAATVTARDAFGNVATGYRGTVHLTSTDPAADLPADAAFSAGDEGVHAFAGVALKTAGARSVTVADVASAALVATAGLTVQPAAASLVDSTVAASPATIAAGGAPATVTVTLKDGYGNAIQGAAVTLSSSVPSDTVGVPAATAADGTTVVTLAGTVAGLRAVTASVGGLPLVQTASVTVDPAAPDAASSSISGPAASLVADGAATATVSVTLRDRFGNPTPGAALSFATTLGALGAPTGTTGAGGEGSVTLTSTVAGSTTVTVSFTGGSLQATVPFVAGPAASLEVAGLPGSLTAGTASTITVTARDAFGNTATAYRGIVRFTSTDPAAVHPADHTFSAGDAGVRAFGGGVTLKTAGARSVTVTDTASATITGSTFTTVSPAAAATLSVAGLASPRTAGAAGTIAVTARDAFGNVATGYRGTVHLTTSDSAAALPADAAFSAGDAGVHAFAGVALRTAGSQSVTASDTVAALTGTQSSILVEPAAAAALAFAVQPAPAAAGATISPAVAVAVRDAFGNQVATPATVTLSVASGPAGATLAGTLSAMTAPGVATFADLSLGVAGSYTLAAGSAGLPAATSAPFSISAASLSPSMSTVVAAPASLVAGGSSTLTVTAADAFGNPLSGRAVTFTATGASNALTQPAGATSPLGVAAGTLSSTRAEVKTITASVGGIALTQRPTVAFRAGAPDPGGSSLAASPSAVPDDGTLVTLTATVGDQFGNPVSGQAVTFSASGTATLTQPAAATGITGKATGVVSALAAGLQTITATVDGTLVAQADVTFTASPPADATSTVASTPVSVPADGTSSPAVTVTVNDRLGRPVQGAAVALAFAAGGATITPPTATTSAAGVASFSVTSSTVSAGILTATVNPGPGQLVLSQRPWLDFSTPAYTVGGVVTGLATSGLVLASPGLPDLSVPSGATSFTFAQPLAAGASYAVTVKTQPAGQACAVLNGSGTVAGNVNGVVVDCAAGWVQVVSGAYHALGLTTDGKLLAWGSNDLGQLGDGTTTQRNAPVAVDLTGALAGKTIASVAASSFHSFAVTSDGKLFAWGHNANGQLGDGTTTQRRVPVAVDMTGALAGKLVASVSAFSNFSLAVTTDGRLFAWGSNDLGQLGDGTTTQRLAPVAVDMTGALAGRSVASVAAGNTHSLAVTTDGKLFAWGFNNNGQLGDTTTTSRTVPVAVDMTGALAGKSVAGVATGTSHSLAVTTAGELFAWGYNFYGQLGDGTTTQRSAPVAVDMTGRLAGQTIAAVAAGGYHSLAVTTTGGLYAWGHGQYGQLGDGTTTQRNVPVAVDMTGRLAGQTIAAVAAGANHSFAVTTRGELFGWGYDFYGQLGSGSSSRRGVPVAAEPTGVLAGRSIVSVASGPNHAFAVTADGKLFAWGISTYGQLGDGTNTLRNAPVAVDMTGALAGKAIAAVAAGAYHSLAVTTDGQLFAWGFNTYGQLGDGTTTPRNAPVAVDMTGALAGKSVAAVAAGYYHSLALTTDGQLFAWGFNGAGQLGDGTATQRNAPVAVVTTGALAGRSIASVAAGVYHSLALATDGQLFAWGQNGFGQLGDGTTTNRNAPVAVVTTGALAGRAIEAVAAGAGANHSLAVTTDGTLFAWGYNVAGQLGDGTTTQRTAPAAVDTAGALAGKAVAGIAGGTNHSLAVTTDGRLLAWGLNNSGQLGDGTYVQRFSPVLVGAGLARASAGDVHSLALSTDGRLLAWGMNNNGQLGDGHGPQQATPIPVHLPPKPDYLAYAPTVITATAGVAIATNVPTWTGTATSFSVTPALPAGLTLDPATGVVSGTPLATSPTTGHFVTATGPTGSTTGLLTVTVN